jgi:hypothetical protein
MKKEILMALAALCLCGSFASCDNDDDELVPNEEQELKYYDYSEKGFFMNGDIKVRGYFDNDSIMEGYIKYVKRTAQYCTTDGEEGEYLLGYGLLVGINNFAKFYSDDIVYNADSTAISCNGQIEFLANNNSSYDAKITATIDSIGKPHLVTCNTTMNGKRLVLQFRETFFKSKYDNGELPKEDDFNI